MSHLNLDPSTDTWHVVLVYLANNGQLLETARTLNIDKSKATYRLGLAGVVTRTACAAGTVTASQSQTVIATAIEYASTMQDRFEAERLVEQIQEHCHVGTELMLDSGKGSKRQVTYKPRRLADGTYPWWEYLNGDPVKRDRKLRRRK